MPKLVASFCRTYRCSPREALETPAVQFFTLLKEGEEMERLERNQTLFTLLEIVSTTFGPHAHYSRIFEQLKAAAFPGSVRLPDAPPESRLGVMQADSVDAANALVGLFGGMRG